MTKRRTTYLTAAFLCLAIALFIAGCATGPALKQEVTTEYLLSKAGFQKLDVNMETPKRAALLNALPPGQISTYMRDGQVLHAYPGEGSYVFIGDEAAYQNYLSLARGRQLCRQTTGANQKRFWECMEEYQTDKGQPKK